jgi:carboxymethylenebutenolidase
MTNQVIEKQIVIRTPDGTADGLLFHPQGERQWPGVIHLTDVFGIRPVASEMAKRLAAEGYAVLMPNIFYRTSRSPVFNFKPNFTDDRTKQRLGELTGPLTPDAVERDASAHVDFLAKQNFVAPGKIGVVGYCFSGAIALRVAAACPDKIAAAASFHGGNLCTDKPTSPHLLLPKVKARLYFGHAVEDRGMPEESIKKLEHSLQAWGGKYQGETYDGAHHGWTTPDSAAYNQPQADRAFQKLTELLRASLG